ncbi:adenylosuccinate synthetase [Candidatus Heimdallarchaeota archaeon B3_Heim]|nr:MAG: adenylosuccinate synthetase [Candidatus Heimdallarchaeota archaeon B3_Heim]
MSVDVVVGGFWGDEGKGKIISHLVNKRKATIVARGGVGPNAGHTIVVDGVEYKLRMIPSGIGGKFVRKLLIGPGVLVNPEVFLEEIEKTNMRGKAFLDHQCGVINASHREIDRCDPHLSKKVGTTGSGSGPANEERVRRKLKLAKEIAELKPFLTDVPGEIHGGIANGEPILLEGTQATYLSLFHGTYPYVTTKDVTASSICADVGIGPTVVTDVTLVFKAYVTRVGEGFLPEELTEEETIKRGWTEYGTVTKRLRRAAPFNVELAKRSIQLNSATKIALTKIDILFPADQGNTEFDKLSEGAKEWLTSKEKEIGMPFTFIGTGPADVEIIDREG